jgi:hypothetical protein
MPSSSGLLVIATKLIADYRYCNITILFTFYKIEIRCGIWEENMDDDKRWKFMLGLQVGEQAGEP